MLGIATKIVKEKFFIMYFIVFVNSKAQRKEIVTKNANVIISFIRIKNLESPGEARRVDRSESDNLLLG